MEILEEQYKVAVTIVNLSTQSTTNSYAAGDLFLSKLSADKSPLPWCARLGFSIFSAPRPN